MRRFFITDLTGGVIAEVEDASKRTLNYKLNGVDTAAVTATVSNDVIDAVLSEVCLLKAYDSNNEIDFFGEIITAEEAAAGPEHTLAITAAGAGQRLAERHVGKSVDGVTYTGWDRGAIYRDLIDLVNADGYTGIEIGTIESISECDAGTWRYKPALEAMLELSQSLDGCDFAFEAVDAIKRPLGVQLARLNVYTVKGALSAALFEYGCGRYNVQSFNRSVNFDNLANSIYSLPPGFPDTTTQDVLFGESQPSIIDNGLKEAMVSTDLVSDDLRQRLVDTHAALRAEPRQTITFTPMIDVGGDDAPPRFKTDYDIGDLVTFRAADGLDEYQRPDVRVDATMRVYNVSIDIDKNGAETVTIGLVQEG